LAMNRRMGASPWVGHTLADLAAVLLRRGRPDDLAAAQAHLDDALAIRRALGMPRPGGAARPGARPAAPGRRARHRAGAGDAPADRAAAGGRRRSAGPGRRDL